MNRLKGNFYTFYLFKSNNGKNLKKKMFSFTISWQYSVSKISRFSLKLHNQYCHNVHSLCFYTTQVGCCGADGSDDFINAMKPVPLECRWEFHDFGV